MSRSCSCCLGVACCAMQLQQSQQAKPWAAEPPHRPTHQLAADATLATGGSVLCCAAARAVQRSWHPPQPQQMPLLPRPPVVHRNLLALRKLHASPRCKSWPGFHCHARIEWDLTSGLCAGLRRCLPRLKRKQRRRLMRGRLQALWIGAGAGTEVQCHVFVAATLRQ